MTLNDLLVKVKQEINEESIVDHPKFEENSVMIDVREINEFNGGYLPGAINLPRGVMEFKIVNMSEIKNDTHIYLYCRSGNRSALAARSLLELGYTNVTSLSGGYIAWAASNPTTLA